MTLSCLFFLGSFGFAALAIPVALCVLLAGMNIAYSRRPMTERQAMLNWLAAVLSVMMAGSVVALAARNAGLINVPGYVSEHCETP